MLEVREWQHTSLSVTAPEGGCCLVLVSEKQILGKGSITGAKDSRRCGFTHIDQILFSDISAVSH